MVRVVPLSVGQTALSATAGVDTEIGGADFSLPVWVKSILGISVANITDLPTAAQSVTDRTTITSNNLPVQPFEAFAAPIGSILGASGGGQFSARKEVYKMNLPVNGGETLNCSMRPMQASTSAHYGNIELLVSDARPNERQRHIKSGTAGTLTAVSTETNGTQYSVAGAIDLVELYGYLTPTTIATSEGFGGRIRFTAGEFDGVNYADLVCNSVGGGLGTLSIAFIDGVSRRECIIPAQQGVSQVNIQDSVNIISSTTIGANVNWQSGVAFEV